MTQRSLDYAHLNVDDSTSSGNSNVLSSEIVNYFNDAYRGNHDAKDPLVSPVFATDDQLAGFPPCLNITPEHGPYRDDDETFAKRLVGAGVEVLSKRFLGVDHGFTEMYFHQSGDTDAVSIAAAEQAVDLMEWELRRHLMIA